MYSTQAERKKLKNRFPAKDVEVKVNPKYVMVLVTLSVKKVYILITCPCRIHFKFVKVLKTCHVNHIITEMMNMDLFLRMVIMENFSTIITLAGWSSVIHLSLVWAIFLSTIWLRSQYLTLFHLDTFFIILFASLRLPLIASHRNDSSWILHYKNTAEFWYLW